MRTTVFFVIALCVATSHSQEFWRWPALKEFTNIDFENPASLADFIKPVTDFSKIVEEIVSEEDPQLKISLYKNLKLLIADIFSIVNDKNDVLTMQKIQRSLGSLWKLPLTLDFMQISLPVQWKIGRAVIDMCIGVINAASDLTDKLMDQEEMNFGKSENGQTENFTDDEILKDFQKEKQNNERQPSEKLWSPFDDSGNEDFEAPLKSFVKPLADLSKEWEKIVAEENPKLGKFIYKIIDNVVTQYNSIAFDKSDGLTYLEKGDKLEREMDTRIEFPLTMELEYMQLSKRVKWKAARAVVDMFKGFANAISYYYDRLLDEDNFGDSETGRAENYTEDDVVEILKIVEEEKQTNEHAHSEEL